MVYHFSDTPPPGWEATCDAVGNVFHSPKWHAVLHDAFGCDTVYAKADAGDQDFSITVFRAGPFRVGYLGFPVGGTISDETLGPDFSMSAVMNGVLPFPIHLLRVPVSGFSTLTQTKNCSAETPETAITDLQQWSEASLRKRTRRDINRALRSDLTLATVDSQSMSDKFFALYRDTVLRHGGSIRYNRRYFNGLVQLAGSTARIRCIAAFAQDRPAGFAAVVLHNDTAYYLHGASDPMLKKLGPSDLLLYESIKWAKSEGMQAFNFMTSPSHQPALVRYKEKWGGVTKSHCTLEGVVQRIPGRLFQACEIIYRTFR